MATAVPERLYRRLAAEMRALIRDGHWPLGTRLAAEPELATHFGVSRTTLRQALGELEAQGLVDRRKRHGTTVIAREPDGRFRMDTGDLEQLLGLARDTTLAIESVDTVDSSRVLSLDAHDGHDAHWLQITGGRRFPDTCEQPPFNWSWIWLPARFASVSVSLGANTRSVYGVLEREFGIRITRVAQRVSAARCPASVATRLGLARGSPVLEIVATLFDASDTPVEHTRTLSDPARFQVHSNTRVRANGRAS